MLKKLTKVLSLLLILCLMVSMFPAVALADEGTEAPVVTETPEETTPVVTPVPEESSAPVESPVPEESSAPVESPVPSETPAVEASPAPSDTPVDNTSADGDEPAADESAADEPGDYSLTNPDEGVSATSLTMGTKPANGTTTGNPFVQGTGGSNSFRIPALVTLNDGTLVAAADARWNTTYDGGGLDTIVSYSTDNGANWTYTFANYLGDNDNTYNGSGSTAFIDPALATDGSTVYMLCDLYPYGVALNGSGNTAPSTAVGFNSDGKLLLSADGTNYTYYLDGTVIKDSNGNAVSGYTVDAYFNITGNGYDTNLFFSDSPFKVVRTGYLYLTESSDSGKTWSAPTLIPNVKTDSEQVCLVGPGRGLVTGDKIIFPVYSYNGSSSSQQMGFIYFSDDGATWTRSANFTGASWSSEAAVVELADGTLRFFYRNGNAKLYYVDYTWGTGWGSAVNTGIATNSNTQISAISYSKTVDGKQVILVSCPTGSNSAGSADSSASARLNGKIFVGYVNSDNTMSWQSDNAISVTSNNSQFMYSCLTELNNGKVAILYENQESKWGTGDNCYYTMAFSTYDLGLTFDSGNSGEGESGGEENNDPVTVTDETTSVSATARGLTSITVAKQDNPVPYTGYTKAVTYAITLNGGDYTDSADIKIPYDSAFDGCNNFIGSVPNADNTTSTFSVDLKDGSFVGTAPHFSDVTISGRAVGKAVDVPLVVGVTSTLFSDDTGNYSNNYTAPAASIATIEITGKDGQEGGVEYKNASVTCNDLISNDQTSWTAVSGYYYTPDGINYYPVYATRSSSGWIRKTYTYTWGYSTTSDTDNVTQIGPQSTTSTRATPNITVYTQSTTPSVAPSTTFSFTGVSAGTTIAVVGSTQYNITVSRKTETVALTVGNISTYTDTNAGSVTVADSTVASATLSNGKLTITGLKEGTTTVTTNTTVYTVTVSDGTPISIKENETTTIAVPELSNGQYVEWSSADSSYVGVAGKYDTTAGAYTNEAILAGQNVTSSPVTVTGTVYNSDGTVAGVYKWLVTVTEGDADTNTSSKGIYFNISTIENCTVYYSINGGELIPVNGTGVTTGNWTENGTYTGHFNIMFFAAPDEGYALTYMSISGSADQYYTLSNGNPDGTGSDAWPFNDPSASTIPSDSNSSAWKTVNSKLHGFRWALLEGNMTIDQMKVLFSNAIALGCDGATTITKNSTDGMGSASSPTVCKFVAQKLPEMDKEITSITKKGASSSTQYAEGMKVEIGDTINYTIKVYVPTQNSTYGNITYSNIKLVDALTGGSWFPDSFSALGSGTSTQSFEYTNSAGDVLTYSGTTTVYSVSTSLTLSADNFSDVVKNGIIINTAELEYTYKSNYSTGTKDSNASAAAEITVEIPSYVIDFGLPVVLDLDDVAVAYGTITSASASYGDVTVNEAGTGVTYTPNQILKGVDYINLELGSNSRASYAVAIYPATTVYYEEGFAAFSNSVNTPGWTEGSKGTSSQTAEVTGSKSNNYGYDGKYASEVTGPSNGSAAVSSTIADAATFSFTGTGVDIYANCTPGSGAVNVVIRDSNNALVKLLIIDTKTDTGTTDATAGQKVDSYSLPIASVTGLAHGTYTVTVRHSKLTAEDNGNPVSLDGFRVYGTLATEPKFYEDDAEDKPTYIELRDRVLKALSVTTANSQYASDIAEYTLAQVYATGQTTEGAVVISSNTSYTSENVQDLLDNGPKNEIFLRQNESLVFTVTTDREVQIGLKAVNSAVTCTVNGQTKNITSSTDMFYTVFSKGEATGGQTITITNTGSTNTGSGILSITKLKICDDPGATLGELTEEDLIPALVSLGYELEPEEPEVQYADAVLTVEVNGQTATLTKNGVVGESATFTAAEIEAAAQNLVPDGYELKDQAADVTVVYGESDTVTFSAEEIPTEPEEPEEPEQPTEPEEPEQPSKPENIISAVIRLFDKIFGSLKGLFR